PRPGDHRQVDRMRPGDRAGRRGSEYPRRVRSAHLLKRRRDALPEQAELHGPPRTRIRYGRRGRLWAPRAIDPERPRMVEDLEVERLEARPVVEVPQVGELVAERVHETRILEWTARGCVAQADLDRAICVADAVAAAHTHALRSDRSV